MNLQFVTAHKSKGLEADYTILINCNSGKYGFPSGKADDPILNLLLSSADQFENGEERRLFYVAMTRTRRHVVFVTDRYRKSKFIKELQDEQEGRELKCPQCNNGELILRSGKTAGRGFKFYGCSNFAYGCSYSRPWKAEDEQSLPKATPTTTIPETQKTMYVPSEAKTPASRGPMDRAPARTANSKLTRSEQNRLSYFIANPRLYTGSSKARSKVVELEKLCPKFFPQEAQQFEQAYSIWKANLK